MDKDRRQFLLSLLNTPSPSGFEQDVQALWRAEALRHTPKVRTNTQGSVIATLDGKPGGPSILLMGHADEIGVLVHYIDDNGFIYFKPIGGIDTPTLVNQRVRLLGPRGLINGVIGRTAVHLMKGDERDKKSIELTDLFIDIGAADRAQAEAHAPIGTPGVIGGDAVELLNGRFAARDVDNKFGSFVALEVLRRCAARQGELAATLHSASTVQEECGAWGARLVAFDVNPTAAIAIDVSHATDTPGIDARRAGKFALGEGPIVNIGVSSSKKLVAAIRAAGEAAGIPVRLEAETGRHGTDADPAAEVRAGVPVATVSNSLRYMHTSVEVAVWEEIEQVCALLTAFVLSVPAAVDYTP
ncbi:MAG: M42 family peptidase [Candidatus Sumerlaeia bacterium]|nr:M42 family peptidase [Candidatus Sumerlaeia bacterium]